MQVITCVLFTLVILHVSTAAEADSCPAVCECTEWKMHTISCRDIDILPRFPAGTETLWLFETRLTSVPADAFAYLVNISWIYISVDVTLQRLERHSFHSLKKITHIQIRNAQILTYIDPEAFKHLPNLKYLGIFNTGLTFLPDLSNIHSNDMNFMLEIADHPYITEIPANSFRGITSDVLTVVLYGNGLREIHNHAFNGTKLDQVDLRRNKYLTKIDERAFGGTISGPLLLDVSLTGITSLPAIGMDSLRKLTARDAWALKKLPPIETFKHLTVANLTYPSHCCGFKNFKKKRGFYEYILCNFTAFYDQHHKRSVGPLGMPSLQGDGVVGKQSQTRSPSDGSHRDSQQDWRRVTSMEASTTTPTLGVSQMMMWVLERPSRTPRRTQAKTLKTSTRKQTSCLSTPLTVITLERWYAITFAMRLDRKLRLLHAAAVMLGGWIFCLLLALLPLVGVSSYQKIYCAVHNPHYRSGSKDTNIAKRMAVLIFTDFLCMAPISFYA
ncbi:hypothetical protein KUCAC02_019444, partial [Chaenocephalus aceratus]